MLQLSTLLEIRQVSLYAADYSDNNQITALQIDTSQNYTS